MIFFFFFLATLSEESTVSCYGVNAVGQGEVKTLHIFMAAGKFKIILLKEMLAALKDFSILRLY